MITNKSVVCLTFCFGFWPAAASDFTKSPRRAYGYASGLFAHLPCLGSKSSQSVRHTTDLLVTFLPESKKICPQNHEINLRERWSENIDNPHPAFLESKILSASCLIQNPDRLIK